MKQKEVASIIVSMYFSSPQLGNTVKWKCMKIQTWSRDILNFDFLKKGSRVVSLSHFLHDFSRKIFLMLCSINWPVFIAWLPLLFEISCNMCIVIVYYPVCGVISLEIYLSLPMKLFSYMIAFTFSDFLQYMYFNCFLSSLWYHKFGN